MIRALASKENAITNARANETRTVRDDPARGKRKRPTPRLIRGTTKPSKQSAVPPSKRYAEKRERADTIINTPSFSADAAASAR